MKSKNSERNLNSLARRLARKLSSAVLTKWLIVIEDELDARLAKQILSESDERIPYEQIARDLGLRD